MSRTEMAVEPVTTSSSPSHPPENHSPMSNSSVKMELDANLQLRLVTTTAFLPPSDDASAERRKQKAAAARRRRRKALSRRQQQSPRSVSQPRVFQRASSLLRASPNPADDEDATDEPTDMVVKSKYSPPVSSSHNYASNSFLATEAIQATVDGLADIAVRWKQEEIIAIPTECTYEACISLQATSVACAEEDKEHPQTQRLDTTTPPDWAYRIERLRQVASASSDAAPYCWVPRSASCPLLNDCFPTRVYAMRDTNGRARLAHRFNEVHEVLQRIARHVWPGPVTIRVAVPRTHATSSSQKQLRSFWSTLTTSHEHTEIVSDENGTRSIGKMACPYLTLRCPRHPLAMRAAQKHSDTTWRSHRRSSASTIHNGQPTTNPLPKTEDQNNPSPLSPFSVLVGFPIVQNSAREESPPKNGFCSTSQQVQEQQEQQRSSIHTGSSSAMISAVLDGEHQHELFAVPPCELLEPWETEIWIHGPSRTINVVQPFNNPNLFAQPEANPFCSGTTNSTTTCATCATRLRNALKQRVPNPKAPITKAKERIIQAVLCRWKVSSSSDQNL